jgi:hypothetical protein
VNIIPIIRKVQRMFGTTPAITPRRSMPLDALAGSKARVRSDKNLKVRLESKCSFSVA